MSFPSPPRTWVAGETVTAAIMNAHVRDALIALGQWNLSWTPVWTGATTNPTLGNGTLVGKYTEGQDWVDFFVHLVIGSTTTFGSGAYMFNLPVTEANRRFSVQGHLFDTSAGDHYPIFGVRTAAGQLSLKCDPTTAGVGARVVNLNIPVTLATGDEVYLAGRYSK